MLGMVLVLLTTVLVGMVYPVVALAATDPLNTACAKAGGDAQASSVCKDAASGITSDPINGDNGIINKVANILAVVAGIGASIVVIWGGFLYATAGGAIKGQRSGDSPNKAAKGRAAIMGGLIGLFVILFARVIFGFVIGKIVR